MYIYSYKPYKIILIGDSTVGKTSILNSYLKRNTNPSSTIGTEFAKKYVNKYKLNLQIWDCAGQERFRALCKVYFRATDICILVFDLSNPSSLKSIRDYWINTYLENATKSYKFILVGNKSDLPITIDYNIIWQLSKTYNMKYIETSSVNKTNIDSIFNTACEFILDINKFDNTFIETNTLNIEDTSHRYNFLSSYC